MKKNNKKNNTMKYTEDYSNEDNEFSARIRLGKNVEVDMRFTVSNDNLHFDDIEDAAYELMNEKYPESSFPEADITRYSILHKETNEWCPVLRESDKETFKRLSRKSKRILVLPEYTYSVTPECRLWMKMKEHGMISENTEFDFDKFHEILKCLKV